MYATQPREPSYDDYQNWSGYRLFQVHGVDENEQTVVRRQLRRSEIAKFFNRLPPTRIGLEASGASHYWARLLRGFGTRWFCSHRNTSSHMSSAARMLQTMPRRSVRR